MYKYLSVLKGKYIQVLYSDIDWYWLGRGGRKKRWEELLIKTYVLGEAVWWNRKNIAQLRAKSFSCQPQPSSLSDCRVTLDKSFHAIQGLNYTIYAKPPGTVPGPRQVWNKCWVSLLYLSTFQATKHSVWCCGQRWMRQNLCPQETQGCLEDRWCISGKFIEQYYYRAVYFKCKISRPDVRNYHALEWFRNATWGMGRKQCKYWEKDCLDWMKC